MSDHDDSPGGRHALFFATSRDLFVCTDPEGLIGSVNPAWEELFGWSADELAGLPLAAFFHPGDPLPPALDVPVRVRLRRRDGTYRPVELLPTGIAHCVVGRDRTDAESTTDRTLTAVADARAAAGVRLLAQQRVAEVLADPPPLGLAIPLLLAAVAEPLGFPLATLWLAAPGGGTLRAAYAWHAPAFHASGFIETTRRLALHPGEDPAGAAWAGSAPGPALFASARAPLARALSLSSALAVPLPATPAPLGALELLSPPRAAGEDLTPLVAALARQLSRFLLREHRRQSSFSSIELKSAVLDCVREAILPVDSAFRVLDLNAAAERLFGRPRSAAVGAPLADVILPQPRRATWRERLLAFLEAPDSRAGRTLELEGRRADGSPFPMELALSVARTAPLALAVHCRDVTESRRMIEQLQRWQRADSVGRLAAGLVHDLNNQLTVITGHAELLLENLPRSAELGEEVVEIRSAGERAMLLTRQLASFGGQEAANPVVVSLNAIVAEMEMMLRRVIGEAMQLETRLDGDVGNVQVDPSHVQQVLLNLAINARDAMQNEGLLELQTRRERIAESYSDAHPELAAGPYAVLAVTDGGPGMDADTLAALFRPFFTTKPEGAGTGLGLATVRSIARRYAGQVTVASEPGRGSRFEIWLPEVPAPEATPQPAEAEPVEGAEPATILLVEDDGSLRTVCRMMLEELGYQVLDVEGPEVALRRAREHGAGIDLLVADVVLPGMSGVELAQRLRAERPGLRVLYMSGHLDNAMVRELEHADGASFLPKPFLPGALASKVRTALREQAPSI